MPVSGRACPVLFLGQELGILSSAQPSTGFCCFDLVGSLCNTISGTQPTNPPIPISRSQLCSSELIKISSSYTHIRIIRKQKWVFSPNHSNHSNHSNPRLASDSAHWPRSPPPAPLSWPWHACRTSCAP